MVVKTPLFKRKPRAGCWAFPLGTVNDEHHLIVTHKVTNVGSDRSQLGDARQIIIAEGLPGAATGKLTYADAPTEADRDRSAVG
jgi:hypothetical protein